MLLPRAFALVAHAALVVTTVNALTIHKHAGDSQQPVLAYEDSAIFRDLQDADIDEVATVILDAFAPSAEWHYTIPGYDKYRDEIYDCFRKDLGAQWVSRDETSTWGKVITVPSTSPGGPQSNRSDKVVAGAFWSIDDPDDTDAVPFRLHALAFASAITNCNPMPGVNITRALDIGRQRGKHDEYLDHRWPRQIGLNILATHPDWDGHGFGARNCLWGMKMAKGLGLPVVLLATPAGWPLYDSLGFESILNGTMTRLDGDGLLWEEIMKWEA